MAVYGVVPVLSPVLIAFMIMAVAGAFLLLLALLRRNLLLVSRQGLNPFSLRDAQRAGDAGLSTRPVGGPPFHHTRYARIAIGLLTLGSAGIIVMLLLDLFTG